MRKTIKDYSGTPIKLGDEIFVITTDEHPSSRYGVGALVRKVDLYQNDNPGEHFRNEYVTVCRVDAETAEFCGVPKRDLIQLNPAQLEALK